MGIELAADFDFGAKLDLLTDAINGMVTAQQKLEQRRLQLIPNNVRMSGLINPGALTSGVYDYGGPQQGREWEIRLWSIDSQPDGSNTGNYLLIAGPAIPGAQIGQFVPGIASANIPTSDLIWRLNAAPGNKDLSPGVGTVKYGQHLMVAVVGAPANTTNVMSTVAFDEVVAQAARGAIALT